MKKAFMFLGALSICGVTGVPLALAKSTCPMASRILELVNHERSEHGNLTPLTLNTRLMNAAQEHSQDMADHNFLNHTGSDGSNSGNRMERAGYPRAARAENIYQGSGQYSGPEQAMKSWMNSPGHRANILTPEYRVLGVGCVSNNEGEYYWTQNFAS